MGGLYPIRTDESIRFSGEHPGRIAWGAALRAEVPTVGSPTP